MRCKHDLNPFQNFNRVLGNDLEGTKLRTYVVVSSPFPQNEVRGIAKLVIDLNMSNFAEVHCVDGLLGLRLYVMIVEVVF